MSNRDERYAIGTTLYALGKLGVTEALESVVAVVKQAKEPYIVEDGIHAIGLLADRNMGEFLRGYLESSDPMIRMKAAEALGRIGDRGAIAQLQIVVADPYRVVRDVAEVTLNDLVGRADKVPQALRDAVAIPMRVGPDDVVIMVTAEARHALEAIVDELMASQSVAVRPHFTKSGRAWQVTLARRTYEAIREYLEP
jgi:HEAT repeat protein